MMVMEDHEKIFIINNFNMCAPTTYKYTYGLSGKYIYTDDALTVLGVQKKTHKS